MCTLVSERWVNQSEQFQREALGLRMQPAPNRRSPSENHGVADHQQVLLVLRTVAGKSRQTQLQEHMYHIRVTMAKQYFFKRMQALTCQGSTQIVALLFSFCVRLVTDAAVAVAYRSGDECLGLGCIWQLLVINTRTQHHRMVGKGSSPGTCRATTAPLDEACVPLRDAPLPALQLLAIKHVFLSELLFVHVMTVAVEENEHQNITDRAIESAEKVAPKTAPLIVSPLFE